MVSLRYVSIISILVIILIFFQYRLWQQPNGLYDLFLLKKNLKAQQAENMRLKQRNDELLFQIKRLRHSKDAVEARARNELGMIKKDETFYQIVK